jgi:hypothetical protein
MGLFGEEEAKEDKSRNIKQIQHNNDDIILRPDRVENAHKRFEKIPYTISKNTRTIRKKNNRY